MQFIWAIHMKMNAYLILHAYLIYHALVYVYPGPMCHLDPLANPLLQTVDGLKPWYFALIPTPNSMV